VNLHASHTLSRVIVLTRAWTTSGPHTVKLVVAGTTGHPRFDLDALLLMR